MTTTVAFYQEPTNLDYLMPDVRLTFGDLDGSVYSDIIIRTALVNAIKFLQRRWQSKYQIYTSALMVVPQPANVPSGYIYANTTDGQQYIPSGLEEGSLFRNPFLTFDQTSPPVIQSQDETAIVLAATYLLRRSQVSSSVASFVSWSTEDIRYSNLGSERGLKTLLESDLKALDDYFASRIAQPKRSEFPIAFIPGLHELT